MSPPSAIAEPPERDQAAATLVASAAVTATPRGLPVASAGQDRLWTAGFVRILMLQVSFGFAFSAFFLLPKFLAVQLHATATEIGRVTAMGLVIAVVVAPLAGIGIDRFSRRALLVLGTLSGALGAIGFFWVDRIGPFLYFLRLLQGASFALTFNTAATLATDLAPPAKLAQAIGYFGVAMLGTNAVAPLAVEVLADDYGWSMAFMVAAVSAAVSVLVALSMRVPLVVRRRTSLWAPLASRRRLSIAYVSVLIGVGFGTMVTYTQPFALSLGDGNVRALFMGYTLTAVLVRVPLGSLVDRIGRYPVAVASMLMYGLVTLSAAALEPGGLFVLGLGLGCAHGFLYPALNALLIEDVPSQERGMVMTTFGGAFNLGFALSVLCLGVLADAAGYPMVFLVAGGVTLSGVMTLLFLPGKAPA